MWKNSAFSPDLHNETMVLCSSVICVVTSEFAAGSHHNFYKFGQAEPTPGDHGLRCGRRKKLLDVFLKFFL